LSQALTDGLNAFEAESTDYDLATTPQLHYLVRCLNTLGTNSPYGKPTEEGYYEKLATAFKPLMQGKKKPSRLTVDCANGVGAPKLADLIKYLGDEHLEIKLVNTDIHNPQKLNFQVSRPPVSCLVLTWGSVEQIMSRLNKRFLLDRFLRHWNVGQVLMEMQTV
jgi:phosphoacetylglucosamine mutase